MSSKISPIEYDPSGCFLKQHGIETSQVAELAERLESVRDEVAVDDVRHFHKGSAPAGKSPLDSHFLDLPEKLLAAYESNREESELGRILATSKRISEQVDRVVVLGIGGSYMGARALMESCCHPYFNELSRADRGGRPRMYFEGNNVDNDASQGLLSLLAADSFKEIEDRWALVVISKGGGTMETAVAFRQFVQSLRSAGVDDELLSQLVIPITGRSGKLANLASTLNCQDIFRVPNGVGGRFSVLSPVGLLPAALLGIDVVALLRGAVAMNEHFRSLPAADNLVLQFVAVSHLMEKHRGANIRVLSVWSKALEAIGLWYDQLFAESLGKKELGATPLTTLNTRDLHSRAQQHQEGSRDKLFTNLRVEQCREDPLAVGKIGCNDDQLDRFADRTLPEIMRAAIDGTNQAYRAGGRPTADITLPACDESSLGQLLQMLMLATVAEGRLLGINPYGQPGVEAYKRNMLRILSAK